MAAFSGMRVESGNQDARLRDTETALQIVLQDAQHAFQQRCRDGIRHLAQRQVRCRQRDTHSAAAQHHYYLRGMCLLGEKFGVSGKGNARIVDDALVHRRGDHAGEFAGQATL